jgi:hypothetical protein
LIDDDDKEKAREVESVCVSLDIDGDPLQEESNTQICSILRMASLDGDPNNSAVGLSFRQDSSNLISIGRSTLRAELIDMDDIDTVDTVVSSSLSHPDF